MLADWKDAERRLTDRVSVLVGAAGGSYPSGNTLLVKGASEAVVIDPSIDVVSRGGVPVAIDAILNSHSHEDHVPGNGFFPNARVHVHHEDLPGVRSVDGLMDVFGYEGDLRTRFEQLVCENFHFTPRPDAEGFSDGHVFDLGGVTIEAVHLPGHTRGHSGFRISEDVFFLSDIDLTGFGPYYGDAWSDLEDFEESLRRVRDEEARWYVTFHHKGVIEGRKRFVEMVDSFRSVIDRRHEAILAFLDEPRSLEELVAHRFVYRPHVDLIFVDSVERRSASLHLERMIRRGEVSEIEPGRYLRV
ncbi:MAG TPA: MBL fold metallo-hydrolase [Deltaproteobacteria bacterium]|nr:MBL fold metallo-hydrolase [Deltaproteobacteria bacterium]